MAFRPRKIISGGQTGVDRAALDAALEAGIACGGFVPKGRLAEDGPLPARYPLEECACAEYPVRTELNVLRSDATLILSGGPLSGGTRLAAELCRRHGKPFEIVDLEGAAPGEAAAAIRAFLEKERPRTLNVAGPRESGSPGIYGKSLKLLRRSLKIPRRARRAPSGRSRKITFIRGRSDGRRRAGSSPCISGGPGAC